jgi:thioredoxin 1
MSAATAVTIDTFDRDVLQSDVPVLVDFWAPWCGPCRMIGPSVDEVATEFQGKAKVYKVNVDEQPEIAQRYGVQSIPTLAIFKGGKVADQLVGAVPKQTIIQKLNTHV